MSVSDEVPTTRSQDTPLTDAKYLIGENTLVEPLEIDGQRPVSLQMFTEVPPHGLQGTILTLKEAEPNQVVFESYMASKSTRVKGGSDTALVPGQSSSFQMQPCSVSSNVVQQKVVLTMPTSGVVDSQCSKVSVSAVRPPFGNQFTVAQPLSARKVRSATDLAVPSRVPASGVVTLIGKSGVVLPSETWQDIRQVGDATPKMAIRAGIPPKSRHSVSGSLKVSGLQPSSTGNKVGRMSNILSHSKTAKKLSNTFQPLSLTASSPSSPTLLDSPVIQVAMTMAPTVAKPKVVSSLGRSQLVASSSQGHIVVNSPASASPATIIPSVSSFGFDVAGGGKVIRIASPRNVSLTPVGTLQVTGASPRVAAGAVRFPVPSASIPRPFHASSIAMAVISQMTNKPLRVMSPLASFRMQTVYSTQKSGPGFSSVQAAVPQVLTGTERPLLKRKASEIEEEQPRKKRKLLSGKVYRIVLPDGKTVAGTWDNSMIQSLASTTTSDGKMVENSAVEKDAVPDAALSNDDKACSNVGGESSKSTSSSDVKLKMIESTEGGNSRLYVCLTCKTLSVQPVPCGTCSAMPQPCLFRSVQDKTNKLVAAAAANTAHLPTPTDVLLPAMPQQVAVNASQPKTLNRIVAMPGSANPYRQFHITRRPLLDQATTPPAVRLGIPLQIHPTIATLGSGIQRAPTPRIMRKKVNVQKRPEPDVVQILSSDDEDSQALESSSNSSQAGALPSVSSSSVAAQPAVTTQESLESCTEPMNTSEAPASIENHLFTMKIRLVRFGTLQKSSVVESSFYVDGIKIVFFKDDIIDSSSLYIPVADLRVVRVHHGPCGPVFFLHATSGVAVRLREIFLMSDQGHIFDPDHKDDACRFITIIPDKNQVVGETFVTEMIEKMQGSSPPKFTVQTINGELASQLLKAKLSMPTTGVSATSMNATQKVIFITANGQIIQRHIVGAELAGQALMVRPMEGEEEEELADRSRSPSPPHPIFIGPIVKLFTYPPPPATGGIAVTNEDFFCLKDGEYLNDVIIDFYLKYLLREMLSKEDRERTHVFSSFFYRRLMQKQTGKHSDDVNMTLQQLRHSRVRTWTRHVDLFSKDFIIAPINESAHWYLAVICFPGLGGIVSAESKQQKSNSPLGADGDASSAAENVKLAISEETKTAATQETTSMTTDFPRKEEKKPCILIFDSLAMPTRYGVVRTLREYLQTEWDTKKKEVEGPRNFNKDNMQGACPRCPRQTNYSDCGVYVLQYVESFFKDPITDFTLPITTLGNWFTEEVIVTKRESLRQLVLRLQKGLNPELEYDPRQNSVDSLTSGSNLQLMSSSTTNTTVAEKVVPPCDAGSNVAPAISSISKNPENCASDAQKNGDVCEDGVQVHANSLMSMQIHENSPMSTETDANSTEPASNNNHSVAAASSLSPEILDSKALSEAAAVSDSQENVCNDHMSSNPEINAASTELEKATSSNNERLHADCTDTNSAMTETSLDNAGVGCQEFSALKISDENNVQAREVGSNVNDVLCQQPLPLCQQPLPVNIGKTQSKVTTSYVSEFSSWLSKNQRKSAEDCNVSSNTVAGLSESEEQMSTSSIAGLQMAPENSCHLSQRLSFSEKMDVDSDSLTGVSSSSTTCENSTTNPLRHENLETDLSNSMKQSSQNEHELAASSCTNMLNANCNAVNDQMLVEHSQV